MWCKSCQQDVPGIASLDEGRIRCARCGSGLSAVDTAGDAGLRGTTGHGTHDTAAGGRTAIDDEVREQLLNARLLLARCRRPSRPKRGTPHEIEPVPARRPAMPAVGAAVAVLGGVGTLAGLALCTAAEVAQIPTAHVYGLSLMFSGLALLLAGCLLKIGAERTRGKSATPRKALAKSRHADDLPSQHGSLKRSLASLGARISHSQPRSIG